LASTPDISKDIEGWEKKKGRDVYQGSPKTGKSKALMEGDGLSPMEGKKVRAVQRQGEDVPKGQEQNTRRTGWEKN